MIFAGAKLELKGTIQYIRKRTFIETILSIKHLNVTSFVLKDTFSLKMVSDSIELLIQKIFFGSSR